MRAKRVFENTEFRRDGNAYDKLGIGHHGIKKAILSQGFPEIDSMEGDSSREWFQNGGLPEEFLEEIDYNPSDPLAFTDYTGFDEDWYIENELPDHVDPEEFLEEFKSIGQIKKVSNRNAWGAFQWQEGRLPDGTRIYRYVDGMNSGFLVKKDWLKKNK
jgi:hypothetical protein